MNNKKTQTAAPKCRFPEFSDSWKRKPLKRFLEEYSEKVPANTELCVYSSSREGLKLQKNYFDNREVINEGDYGTVPEGFFVYRHMSDDTIFKFNINNTGQKIAVSKEYPVFKAVDINSNFLLQLLNGSADFKYFAAMQRKGGTRTRLYFKTLCEWEPLLPSTPEQNKIAGCLTSLDELIAAEIQKLDKLQENKKGLMQKLFPKDDEISPEFRFPEFHTAPEWEKKTGDKIFSQISNKDHDSTLPILAITQEHGAIPRDEINYHVSVSNKSIKNYKVVEAGDFIISLRSFQGGIEYSNYQGLCSPAYVVLRNESKIFNCYFKYLFKTERFIRYMTRNIEGLRDGKMISYKQFSELMLPFPTKDKEQQKIVECLSSADNLIMAQSNKIKVLQKHKRGLIQQLFPPAEEIT